jgi:hypothetical protein
MRIETVSMRYQTVSMRYHSLYKPNEIW